MTEARGDPREDADEHDSFGLRDHGQLVERVGIVDRIGNGAGISPAHLGGYWCSVHGLSVERLVQRDIRDGPKVRSVFWAIRRPGLGHRNRTIFANTLELEVFRSWRVCRCGRW